MEDDTVYDNCAGRAAEAAEEPAEAADDKESSKLPVQLSRLPVDKLQKIQQALAELEAAGLSEVQDISKLQRVVGEKTGGSNARVPLEEFTTKYMEMSLWAWTPKRWFENTTKEVVAAGAKSSEAAPGNSNEESVPELSESAPPKRRAVQRIESSEFFKTWWDAMKKAEAEIRSWKDLDSCASLPTQAGDGLGCVFQVMPGGPGPLRELPKAVKYPTGGSSGPLAGRDPAPMKPPPSVMMLHFGETGCGTGHAAWQRIMSEHGLGADGRPKDGGSFYGRSCVHFAESVTGRYVPKAIFAGYGGMDAVSTAGMFDPSTILQKTSPGSRWQDGYGHASLVDEVVDRMRLQCEKATCSGMILTHSLYEDGPTSGFASKLLQRLSADFGKTSKFCIAGTPDCMEQAGNDHPTTWAHCGLAYHSLMEHTDVASFYDRTALAKLASSKLNGLGMASPGDRDLNGLLARLVTSLTVGMRHVTPANLGSRNFSLIDLQTNLVPYPRIHFCLPALGGLVSEGAADFAVDTTPGTETMGHAFFKGSMSTANTDRFEEKVGAVAVLGRGLEQCALLSKVMEIRHDRRHKMVDWNPGGFALESINDPAAKAPEVAILENHINAKHIFNRWKTEVEKLDEDMFGGEAAFRSDILEDLAALGQDYNEVGAETAAGEDEDEEEE